MNKYSNFNKFYKKTPMKKRKEINILLYIINWKKKEYCYGQQSMNATIENNLKVILSEQMNTNILIQMHSYTFDHNVLFYAIFSLYTKRLNTIHKKIIPYRSNLNSLISTVACSGVKSKILLTILSR